MNLVYDVDVRLLFIECLNAPQMRSRLCVSSSPRLSVMPRAISQMRWMMSSWMIWSVWDWSNENQVTILTCKKEITLELTGKPFTEQIS